MAEIQSGITLDQVNALIAQAVSGVSGGQSAAQVNSAINSAISGLSIPTMATAAPPGVADSSAAGAASMQYAGSNHTHASKARKTRVTGITTATYTWVYPTPFGVGVVPVVNAVVEDPTNSATDSYNVQVVGVPTNTQCQFRIIRQSTGLIALSIALSFNSSPGNVNLHCIALEP